jgi:superfamily II DNA/RNA helicase
MSYAYRSKRAGASRSRRPNFPRNNQRKSGPRFGQYIDPSRFVATAVVKEEEKYVPTNTFTDFALDAVLQRNLSAKGYQLPSPIQDQAIPISLAGKDVIGLAGTGTGKTAAFALPVLQALITSQHAKAIIIAPTRELAQQIDEEMRDLGRGVHMNSVLIIGGTGMGQQLGKLRSNPRVVIGTPGRIKDHMRRGSLRLANFNLVVLDEVDRMLDMGFINDVQSILEETAAQKQSFFFSATMDAKVQSLIEKFGNEPVSVSIKASSASENVHQDVVHYSGTSEKMESLHDLLISGKVSKAIVFDETQRNVEKLHKELLARGFKTESIHGGKTQGQRKRALASFKENKVNILIATDVAARGIDVADISHVINYSVPKVYEDYIHRIGRAGRAGKVGHALTFVKKEG